MTRWALVMWLLVSALGGAARGHAQPASPTDLRIDAQDDHLMRVGAWGGASLVSGVMLIMLGSDAATRSYGVQTTAWGAANLTIAGMGLAARGHALPRSADDERAAEERFARILAINLQLNAGYVALGTAVWVTAPHGTDGAARRGHGAAIVTQGLTLLLLDGVAYVALRRRHAGGEALARVRPSPYGAGVVVAL